MTSINTAVINVVLRYKVNSITLQAIEIAFYAKKHPNSVISKLFDAISCHKTSIIALHNVNDHLFDKLSIYKSLYFICFKI